MVSRLHQPHNNNNELSEDYPEISGSKFRMRNHSRKNAMRCESRLEKSIDKQK